VDGVRSGFAGTTSTTNSATRAGLVAVFLASAIGTVDLCESMKTSMPMPGGWSMSMAWMRMPGQTWLGAAAMFVAMWSVMMIAMMMPAIAPLLAIQRRFAAVAGAAYFLVWSVVGVLLYPIGIAIAIAAMRSQAVSRAVPLSAGVAIAIAGCVQLTPWKLRELSCCRMAPESANARAAWRIGMRSGVDCVLCCTGFMIAFVVAGVMSLVAMAVTGAAIAIERLSPWPHLIARVLGVLLLVLGTVLIVRAIH